MANELRVKFGYLYYDEISTRIENGDIDVNVHPFLSLHPREAKIRAENRSIREPRKKVAEA